MVNWICERERRKWQEKKRVGIPFSKKERLVTRLAEISLPTGISITAWLQKSNFQFFRCSLLHHFYISIDITITLRTTTISTEGE
jgi:hypothetical protein